jgi:hypothetical protein
MKITLKNTAEQIELVQAMASRDPLVRMEAQTAFAEFMGKVLGETMAQANTIGNFYTNMPFAKDSVPSIPLDLFAEVTDLDWISIWSQHADGGLGTNELKPPTQETYLDTYQIDSAISVDKRHAKGSRLDVISKCMTRMAQEILWKQDNFAIGPLMSALANASTNGKAHVVRVAVADRFLPQDLAQLRTRMKRINTSFIRGTPAGNQGSITDMLISPEAAEALRSMAYNAINTAPAPQTSPIIDGIAAPESIRAKLFESAGMSEFMGINFHEFNEFGDNQRFNLVFDAAAGGTTYYQDDGASGGAVFAGTTDTLMVGLDRSGSDALLRLTATDSETGSEFNLMADNQFEVYNRTANKIGWYGSMEEGRVILNNRKIMGLVL